MLTKEHTFDEALKITLSTVKATEKDVAVFSHSYSAPVNKVDSGNHQSHHPSKCRKGAGTQGKSKTLGNNTNNSSECLSCRKPGHPHAQCKYRNHTCHSCSKAGHIADPSKSKSEKMEELAPPQVCPPKDSVDLFSLSLYNLSSGKHGIEVPVEPGGPLNHLTRRNLQEALQVHTAHVVENPVLAYIHCTCITQDTQSRYMGKLMYS